MMNERCPHCTAADGVTCPGRRNARICQRTDPGSPSHAPGLLERIAGFAAATAHHVAAGMPMASHEQKDARMTLCHACVHFGADGLCGLCGCNLAAKASWLEQSCPLGKWSAIEPGSSADTR